MKNISDQDKLELIKFVDACKEKRIDPEKSEADRRRAVLVAQNMRKIAWIYGDRLDEEIIEIYQNGKEFKKEKIDHENKAKYEEKQEKKRIEIAEKRMIDVKIAKREKDLSETKGQDKILFFCQEIMHLKQQAYKDAREAINGSYQVMGALMRLSQEKEKGWGIPGGIAAGVTGSTVIGAAVAADTMRENAEIRKRNEEAKAEIRKLSASIDRKPLYSMCDRAEKEINQFQKFMDGIKLLLVDDRPLSELMDGLSLGQPKVAFTDGETMRIRVEVTPKKNNWRIAGDVKAKIDGSFIAEVYEKNRIIGQARLNLPFGGIEEETVTIEGFCLEAQKGKQYKVLLYPYALWLVEHYSAPGGKIIDDGIMEHLKWKPISCVDILWTQRLSDLEEEERIRKEKKAAKARLKKQRRKTIRVIGAATAVVLAMGLAVNAMVIQPSMKYKEAESLMAAGEYAAAAEAFTALGGYSDAAERAFESYYVVGTRYLQEQKYFEAASVLMGIRGYRDVEALFAEHTELYDTYFSVGNEIFFGSYEQDGNVINGAEDIEWLVLDKEGDKVLLLSKYGLVKEPYNTERADVTWETCTLRTWLNQDFLNTAFSSEEQAAIQENQVFLLSYKEAFEDYFTSDEERICKPTAYVVKLNNDDDGAVWWWLRSPGGDQGIATLVDDDGSRDNDFVDKSGNCVRPALWINLKSDFF